MSDSKFAVAVKFDAGLGSGEGNENSLDVLSRLAVRDIRLRAISVYWKQ